MADSEEKRKRGKGDRSSRKQNASEPPEKPDRERAENLIKAFNHRVRRRILRLLHDRDEARSPAGLARELSLPLSTVSYHVQVLKALGLLAKTGERQVRGAIEHFYESMLDIDEAVERLLEETRGSDEDERPASA